MRAVFPAPLIPLHMIALNTITREVKCQLPLAVTLLPGLPARTACYRASCQHVIQKGDDTMMNSVGRKIHLFYTILVRLVTLYTVHAGALCGVLPAVGNVGYVSARSTAGGVY